MDANDRGIPCTLINIKDCDPEDALVYQVCY